MLDGKSGVGYEPDIYLEVFKNGKKVD